MREGAKPRRESGERQSDGLRDSGRVALIVFRGGMESLWTPVGVILTRHIDMAFRLPGKKGHRGRGI